MKYSLTYLLFLIISASSVLIYGQDIHPEFNHIDIKQGLANNRIDCMLQDQEGYIWFGTKRGLSRYNGYEFKTYKSQPGDSTSLRYHQISSLYQDENNTLWVGCISGGLHIYNRKDDNFSPINIFPKSVQENSSLFDLNGNIIGLESISENELWVIHTHGITSIDKKSKEIIFFKNINDNNSITSLVSSVLVDKSGLTLLAIENKQLLYYYDNIEQKILPLKWKSNSNFTPNKINKLYDFDDDNVWLLSDKGLFNFNKVSSTISLINKNDAPKLGTNLNFIINDFDKNLWLGGDNLFFYDNKKNSFKKYYKDDGNQKSIDGNILTCALKDDQKNLWFGTFSRGVNVLYSKTKYFNPNQHQAKLIESLSKNITAIYKSNNGMLLLGTWDKGLQIIDSKNQILSIEKEFPKLKILKNKIIRTIASDDNGDIWIGTNDGILVDINPIKKTVNTYTIENRSDAITSIIFTKTGKIWVAGNGGVFVFNKKTETFFEQKNKNTTVLSVLDMVEDIDGNIWVTSYSDGLFMISENNIKSEFTIRGNENTPFPKEKFVTVYRDSRNRIWAGSEFNGLFLYLPLKKQFQQFTVKDGLPSNDICSIQEDSKGRLWIGTNNGLSRFSYSLNDFKNYFWSDGMNADEFHYNSNFTDKNGMQYFGCTNGIVFFDPDEIRGNYLTYPVKIEDLSINNGSVINDINGKSIKESLRSNTPIKLKYNHNTISLKYTTLNYSLAKKSNFAYQLKGFDDDFNYVNNKRQVTYTNLSSGKYTFIVKASNNDNIWNEKGTEFSFIIQTPPWFQWWAFIIYFIISLLIIYAFRYRILHEEKMKNAIKLERMEKDKQEELNQMKLRFFTNISHEFKTPLTLIIGPLEQLIDEQHGNSKLKQKLSQISDNSKRLLKLINQLIDFRKVEQDVLPLNKSNNDLMTTVQKTMDSFSDATSKNKIIFSLDCKFESLTFNYD